MKKITLCLFVLCSIVVQAQWKQSLTGQASLIRDISVVSNDVVWVKDQNGNAVSTSTDGGNSWVNKFIPTNMVNGNSIGGFSAVSATTAYMVVGMGTQKGVYKTTDSGDSWVKQTPAFNSDSSFPDIVYFWNENEGVAIGDATPNQNFEIYTTTNGGTQWNQVSSSNMPSGDYDWTSNSSSAFRVHGNSIYFMTGAGKIFKSVNKGLSWTVINTPIPANQNFSFDFKDDLRGLISYRYANTYQLYSTSDGGLNWISINTTNYYDNIYYNPVNGVYFSTDLRGLTYSKDNGNTWNIHPTFENIGVTPIAISSTGKMFMGGLSYVYSTENYEGVNIKVNEAKITGSNTMDITYSENADPSSSQDMTNYAINYIDNKISKSLTIQSLTQDGTNPSIVHITMQSSLPFDTIIVTVGNVMDHNGVNGFPVIYRSIVLFNTSKTINVITAGTLSSILTTDELAKITTLTITGTIDASDFVTLRDAMSALATLDLSGVTIAAYNGPAGPAGVKAFLSPAIKTSSKTGLDDPLNRIRAQQIKMQVGTVVATAYPANEIPEFAFCNPSNWSGKASLKSISMPSSITSIGDNAFYNCTGLTEFIIDAANLHYSSQNGVLFNKNATLLIQYPGGKQGIYTIPSSVTSIGESAFKACYGLTGITIPNSVISIGGNAFWNCYRLTVVTIPNSVTSIGDYAFAYCFAVSGSLSIPNSVTSIGDAAFAGCSGLTEFIVDASNLNYSSQEGVLFDKNGSQLIQCPGKKQGTYTIPSSVTSIGNYAFAYCTGLSSVTLPGSVTSIGSDAFENCTGLSSVALPGSVTSIGSYAFYYCTGLTTIYAYPVTPVNLSNTNLVFEGVNKTTCTLYVLTGSKAAYQIADQWKDFGNIVEFEPLKPYTQLSNIRPYYIIGLGDGIWNNKQSGLGASLYPMSLVSGNSYNSNGDGTFIFTGYFQVSRSFKLIRDIGSWDEQWGQSGSTFVHNDGSSVNIIVPSDGYYTLTLNSINNTLFISPATVTTNYSTIGLIGEFNSWGTDVAMTATETTNNHEWYTNYTFTSDFTPPISTGGCKFHANSDRSVNWGEDNFPRGIGVLNGSNIPYKSGNYIIFLNDIDGTYYFDYLGPVSGNNEQHQLQVGLTPNPAVNSFSLNGLDQTVSVFIYDLSGAIVLAKQVTSNETISINTLSKGMYIVKIKTAEGTVERKLIKK